MLQPKKQLDSYIKITDLTCPMAVHVVQKTIKIPMAEN